MKEKYVLVKNVDKEIQREISAQVEREPVALRPDPSDVGKDVRDHGRDLPDGYQRVSLARLERVVLEDARHGVDGQRVPWKPWKEEKKKEEEETVYFVSMIETKAVRKVA